jgi:hypothetical protein
LNELRKIRQPSSRTKFLCRKLESLYRPPGLEPQRSTTQQGIQILSMEKKVIPRHHEEEYSNSDNSDEDAIEERNQINKINQLNNMFDFSELIDDRY